MPWRHNNKPTTKMATKILLSKAEFKSYASVDDAFPNCDLKAIRRIEQYEFRHRLGWDFYTALLDDLNEPTYTTYASGTTYNQDDVVSYKGVLYTATAVTTTALPTVATDWTETDKFTTECYNDLWCDGSLAEFLSLAVLKDMIPKVMVQVSGSGLTQGYGQTFKPAGHQNYEIRMRSINKEIEMAFDNLHHYMINNKATGCYGNYKNIDDTTTTCDEDGSPVRTNKPSQNDWQVA